MTKMRSFLVGTLLLQCGLHAEAKLFRNAYVTFNLPDHWNCKLESTEWICRSTQDAEFKESVIVLTAKEAGTQDNLQAYMDYLKAPRPVAYKKMGNQLSRVIYPPKKIQINGHTWVDGLHLASELPNYYTRYLATIQGRIGILMTFTAHKDQYAKYQKEYFRVAESLRPLAIDVSAASQGGTGKGGILGPDLEPPAAVLDPLSGAQVEGAANRRPVFWQTPMAKGLILGLAVLFGLSGVWLLLRSRRR